MNIIETSIPDVCIIEPKVFSDERGFFFESYNEKEFMSQLGHSGLNGDKIQFVQDNHSRSTKNVLRGLHYQAQQPQGKLVRVISGKIFDIAVDLRKISPTFGQWTGTVLSDEFKQILWVPPGFAHGFLVLSETTDFLYKTTDFYAPEHERTLAWDDPELTIEWPLQAAPILSKKDKLGTPFSECEVYS